MTWELLSAFCLVELLLCLTPGPAVLLVTSTALGSGARRGLLSALGVVAGNMFYFMLSATGIAVLLLASHRLFVAIQWTGAAYLVWCGVRMLWPAERSSRATRSGSAAGSVLRGFVAQVANPKALIFFVALLPQFLDARAPLPPQLCVLGLGSALIELAVLALYIAIAERARGVVGPRFRRVSAASGGAVLIALGVRLALIEQKGP